MLLRTRALLTRSCCNTISLTKNPVSLLNQSYRSFSLLPENFLQAPSLNISDSFALFISQEKQKTESNEREEYSRLPTPDERKKGLRIIVNWEMYKTPKSINKIIHHLRNHSQPSKYEFTVDEQLSINKYLKKMERKDNEYIAQPFPSLSINNPQSWYPKTRLMKRKFIYHYGPTNSGKTYHAMKRLQSAQNGVYCAPLRLLAWEIYEQMCDSGLRCKLRTGEEEFNNSEHATHISCTIEMANISEIYDVVVIDEIQLMASDVTRGGSWTKALLAMQAKEIHVCGDETVRDLLINLVKICDDTLEFIEYKRLCPLQMDKCLTDFHEIRKGDCIVAFNRRDLFRLKSEIEKKSTHRCALIYGRLPPENRRTQAKLFNNPDSGYDVLLASDAIGMGLNLNIRRIIFFHTKKFDGKCDRFLTCTEILQIGGRAGRYQMYDKGYVTCMNAQDHKRIAYHLHKRPAILHQICVKPDDGYIEEIAMQYPWLKFSDVLRCFESGTKANTIEEGFFMPQLTEMIRIAIILDDIQPLSIADKYVLSTVPMRSYSVQEMAFIQDWATKIAQDKVVTLDGMNERLLQKIMNNINDDDGRYKYMDHGSSDDIFLGLSDVTQIEMIYNLLSCYMFLALRFPSFVEKDKCQRMLQITANMIQFGFDDMTITNKYQWMQVQTLESDDQSRNGGKFKFYREESGGRHKIAVQKKRQPKLALQHNTMQ